MKLDLIGGSIVGGKTILREQYDGGGGGGSGGVSVLKNTSLGDRLPQGQEKGTWYYKDHFSRKIQGIGSRKYYFPTINQDVFQKNYSGKTGLDSLKRKIAYLKGTILGKYSLQALINDCSFLGGKQLNDVSKKLTEVSDMLGGEYIDEEKLDEMILSFASMLDSMNELFYSNASGRNPLVESDYIPEDLSAGENLPVQDFIAHVAKQVQGITEWTFVSDKEKYSSGSIIVHSGGMMC